LYSIELQKTKCRGESNVINRRIRGQGGGIFHCKLAVGKNPIDGISEKQKERNSARITLYIPKMRRRRHIAAVILLLSALPHLLADDSSLLIQEKDNNDDVHLDLLEQQQQEHEEPIDADQEDHDVPPTADGASSPQHEDDETNQQQQQEKTEPLLRPQQQDTGVGQQNDGERLASSLEYEDPQFDKEERISDDYSSTLATDDGDTEIEIDAIDTDSESNESNGKAEIAEDLRENSDEGEYNASQTVHADGFRLPALSKIKTMEDNYPASEDKDEIHQQADYDDSSIPESETIETDDDSSEQDNSQPNEPSDSAETDYGDHKILHDHGHTHIELSETAKESLLEEVVVVGDDLGSFGSIGTTNTDEEEIEDEEVVVLENTKLAIGTTSIESIEDDDEEDVDVDADIIDSDGLVIDAELIEEEDEGSKSQNNLADDSPANPDEYKNVEITLENVTEEISDDETDGNVVTEHIGVVDDSSVDDSSIVDGHDVQVDDSGEKEHVDKSNKNEEQEVDDEDGLESSDGDEESTLLEQKEEEEKIEEEKQKIKPDDDEDDDDLTDRVSVDYASKSAGALIIEKTAEFKGTSSLITGDRDKYAIVPCSEERKQIVMSLSEDILVKEIKLANYERFSSTMKDFQVKGSHTLGKWVDLGSYEAKSGNGEQTFVLENPTWARYLKFRFLTHHGSEWYCTLSQIKVHGSNMVQGFHEQWESIEEENNEEQIEVEQPNDAIETSNGDDKEKTDADANTQDTGKEVDTDINLSNASVAPKIDPESSTENGYHDGSERGGSGPRHAQFTPYVHSKPKPLDKFRNPTAFSEIIQGKMVDEKLFSDLYNLIPHTMSNLPAQSKNDLMCKVEDSELRSVHQIGRLAMESLYSLGSRIVDDMTMMVTDDADSGTIVSPKMNEFSDEYYHKRFGSGLSSMINLNANSIINKSSTSKTESSGNAITDGSTHGTDESSSAQQTNETHEETPGEVSVTGSKSPALASKKEEPSTPAVNASVEETNDSLDLAIVKLLKDLPSAECLVNLDFAEFKNKVSATRKSTHASGSSNGGRMMEPIFKKLTDELFALQTSLSVHDQFAKMSVGCYQRVILDLALESEKLRWDQDERLRKLEEQILEPATLQMFHKVVVSLVSTIATWLRASRSYLFVTMKDVWVPKTLRYVLSKDTYEGLHNSFQTVLHYHSHASSAFRTVLDYSSQAMKTVTISLESNGWTKATTYQEFLSAWYEFLSAWSAYYDGGMTVVAIVITILFCRIIMMFSSIRRRNNNNNNKISSSSVRSTRNESSLRKSNSTTSSRTTATNIYSKERLQAPPSASKKKKSRKSKSKHRSETPASSVPIAEDVSTKHSEESIPELKDEALKKSSSSSNNNNNNNKPMNGRDARPTTNNPSVISLEEEEINK
jgi:hypothetical protein